LPWIFAKLGYKLRQARNGRGLASSRVCAMLEEAHFSDAKKALPSTVVSRAGE
jgi:hypothetical protein